MVSRLAKAARAAAVLAARAKQVRGLGGMKVRGERSLG
jgi:hypothetical protein